MLDRVDEEAEALAVQLSEQIPVALIDHFALQGLSRLGAASPLAEAETYYNQAQQPEHSGPSKLQLMAVEKLEAARVLAEREMQKPALELVVSAMLAKAGDLAGLDKPIAASEAGVWLYGEALPQGLLIETEANLLMRGIGFN